MFVWSTPSSVALSGSAPIAEALAASAGSAGAASRSDHQHPRLTSATVGMTDATGKKTVMFTRTFSAQPAVFCELVEAADNGPVSFKIESFLDDTGTAWAAGKPYGGVVITAYRIRALPTLNLAGIVLIGPLLTALGVLSAFAPFTNAPNVSFSCIAILPSG